MLIGRFGTRKVLYSHIKLVRGDVIGIGRRGGEVDVPAFGLFAGVCSPHR